jgi:hypothetical protein
MMFTARNVEKTRKIRLNQGCHPGDGSTHHRPPHCGDGTLLLMCFYVLILFISQMLMMFTARNVLSVGRALQSTLKHFYPLLCALGLCALCSVLSA